MRTQFDDWFILDIWDKLLPYLIIYCPQTAARYHLYQITNRNTALLSPYNDGHVIAAQPIGK